MSLSPITELSDQGWIKRLSSRVEQPYLSLHAFYSSTVGAVTRNPSLMVIPVDDHMVHRGHGVFDAGAIRRGGPLELEQHVLRLLHSADSLGIRHGQYWTTESIEAIIMDTIRISECEDGMFRVFLSAGKGSFGIHSSECSEPCLYVIVYTDRSLLSKSNCPHAEVTVRDEVVPLKHPRFAAVKSVNYMNNVFLADYALTHGGRFGIWIGADGYVKESSILGLLIISPSGVLLSPSGQDILESSTVRRICEFCISNDLVRGVQKTNVNVQALFGAAEVILCGADVHIHPIVMIDGKLIGDGNVGPVAQALSRYADTFQTRHE